MSTKLKTGVIAKLRRKAPGFPVFVVVPAEVVAPWKLQGTKVVEETCEANALVVPLA